ncbi:MAG TPA: GtrA family protein [Bacteroidales bacterium]|jgi:putative flippase GtrA|nr:GtrA family protein [Bacteroidales bacterium]
MIDFVKVRKALFTEKTESTVVQLFRYTFVGGLAFIVDFGTLFILTEYLNLFYLISAGIAFILGLITNYALSVNWVFSNRTLDSKGMEFFLFTVIGLIGLGLNELLLWTLTDLLSIYYLFSKIITAIIIYLWNFFARKYLLFNKK